jgi:hypothetical protein
VKKLLASKGRKSVGTGEGKNEHHFAELRQDNLASGDILTDT